MTAKFLVNDVVQFLDTHKWCPCYGTIEEVKKCGDDYKYLIGVPIPNNGDEPCSIAYIFSMESDNDFIYIGRAIMIQESIEEEFYE